MRALHTAYYHTSFDRIFGQAAQGLILAEEVDVGEVHAQDVSDKPEWMSREIENFIFTYNISHDLVTLREDIRPNLTWAEDHFLERVSGEPLNPPPSAAYWPYAQQGHEEHVDGEGRFSHTYPERMWPKQAARLEQVRGRHSRNPITGIRFEYGDLSDLLTVLARNPYTRQAYLPIWFPEDLTAAVFELRVPCTLGYHFLLREGKLNMTYFIRSCDLVRFFRDDVYMACRLVQWVVDRLQLQVPKEPGNTLPDIFPGTLTMHICSLHCFAGDIPNLRKNYA